MTASEPEFLVVGHITKAHGTKGEVFVWPLSDHAEAVFAPGQELFIGADDGTVDGQASIVAIESARPFKRGYLVKLVEVAGREDAESLAQRYLLLPRAALPPLEDDEVFYHELLAMTVETVAGEPIGRVREVFETDPHHLLEVVDADGRARLIPFAQRIVHAIDRAGGRIVIDPPAGLLDL